MNLFLHNIGEIDGHAPVSAADALFADQGERYDYVLANPPFGKKSALSFTNDEDEQETDDLTYNRQAFWATTSNKQLNFVQQHPHHAQDQRTWKPASPVSARCCQSWSGLRQILRGSGRRSRRC